MAKTERAGPARLVFTLGVAGLLSGLVLVVVFLATQPLILQNQREALEAAIYRVLPGAESRRAFRLQGSELELIEESGDEMPSGDVVYGGYDAGGDLVGFAVPSEGAGFQDTIRLIYGYRPDEEKIVGMEVLDSKETPGLGDKILKDESWLQDFRDLSVEPRVEAVPAGSDTAPNEVDTISGATISSKAVINIINQGNEKYLEALNSYEPTGNAGESEEQSE